MAKKAREDRISALPDCLIHHILSFLVLKRVISTSVLSKRWRFFWTSVPTLNLGNWVSYMTPEDTPSLAIASLMKYDCPKIQKFRVHVEHDNETLFNNSHVDFWIIFATERNVEELDLSLREDIMGEYDSGNLIRPEYEVPDCLLNCQSLRVLKLGYFELNLHPALSLSLCLLKELELIAVRLSEYLDISGCPLLESLVLFACNQEAPINIFAPNLKLKYLKITENVCTSSLTLFAPNLQSIVFERSLRESYNFKNLSSLKSATFIFDHCLWGLDDVISRLGDVLQGVLHSTTILILSHGFMRALQYNTEIRLPTSRATVLQLEIMLKAGLPGTVSVLRSTPYLESLILNIIKQPYRLSVDISVLESLGLSLSAICHLKRIKINNFLVSQFDLFDKRFERNLNIDEFLNNWETEIKLVKTLLGSCATLEKMSISTIKIPSWPRKSEFLLSLSKRLMTCRRASSKAELYLS